MQVRAKIKNPHNRTVAFKKSIYLNNSSAVRLKSVEEFNNLKKYEPLEVEIVELIYKDIKELNITELRLLAEYKGIENYWTKNKETLIKDLGVEEGDE